MTWRFRVRDKIVKLKSVDSIRAVFPTSEFRSKARLRDYRVNFGEINLDDNPYDSSAQLSVKDRRQFERGGWWFVVPTPKVVDAARRRDRTDNSTAVREVYVNDSGAILIGTSLATVKLPPDMTEEQAEYVLESDGLKKIHKLNFDRNLYEVEIPPGPSLPEVIERLQSSGRYVWAEPSLLQAIKAREAALPTDPEFGEQWQHRNTGFVGPVQVGVPGEDLDSLNAWTVTRGAGVRIAVIDSGMQIDHPDLVDGIVGGGFFRSAVSGIATFVPLVPGMTDFPDHTHGTFCMGLAAARTNAAGQQDQGGCGMAPDAKLIAVSCGLYFATQTTLARAVNFAVDPSEFNPNAQPEDGADVISCSLDTNQPLLSVMETAITHAGVEGRKRDGVSLGIPIFWAVNNRNTDIVDDPVCGLPEVLAVGKYDRRGLRPSGAIGDRLAFLAPGVDVFSTRSNSINGKKDGTSFATALAAGVGALVLSVHPDWTAEEVREKLKNSCEPMNATGEYDPRFGFGKLNAFMAVS